MTTKEKLERARLEVLALENKLKVESENTPRPGYWFKSLDPDSNFCVYVESVSACGEVFQFYGWDSGNDWGNWGSGSFTNMPHYEMVSNKEVELRMFEELEKRGFKAGIEMDRAILDSPFVCSIKARIDIFSEDVVKMHAASNDIFHLDGNVVFAHGVFATIVDKPLEIKGYELWIDEETGYVTFGCKSFGDRCVETIEREIRQFNIDCSTELNIQSIVLEGGIEVDTKDLATIVKAIKKHRNEKS